VLEQRSDNIFETRKDSMDIDTMEGLLELAKALLNGTIGRFRSR